MYYIISILVRCIKETYTWEGDGEQHSFSKVKKGHNYIFDKRDGVYWLDKRIAAIIDGRESFNLTARGLEEKYFNEMFERI